MVVAARRSRDWQNALLDKQHKLKKIYKIEIEKSKEAIVPGKVWGNWGNDKSEELGEERKKKKTHETSIGREGGVFD